MHMQGRHPLRVAFAFTQVTVNGQAMDESKGGRTWIDHIEPYYKIWPAPEAVAFNGGLPWLVVPPQSAIGAVFTPAPMLGTLLATPISPDSVPSPTARDQRQDKSEGVSENGSLPHPADGVPPPPITRSPPPPPVGRPFWPMHVYSPPPHPLPPPRPEQSPDWPSALPYQPTHAANLHDALISTFERLKNTAGDLQPTHIAVGMVLMFAIGASVAYLCHLVRTCKTSRERASSSWRGGRLASEDAKDFARPDEEWAASQHCSAGGARSSNQENEQISRCEQVNQNPMLPLEQQETQGPSSTSSQPDWLAETMRGRACETEVDEKAGGDDDAENEHDKDEKDEAEIESDDEGELSDAEVASAVAKAIAAAGFSETGGHRCRPEVVISPPISPMAAGVGTSTPILAPKWDFKSMQASPRPRAHDPARIPCTRCTCIAPDALVASAPQHEEMCASF